MENPLLNASRKPHDLYFERVFKVKPLMLELLGQILDEGKRGHLDLSTLSLASESFITEELRESLSDLVYTCALNQGKKIRICLLFEHKSYNPGKRIYPQIGRYLIGVQEEDINQRREFFTPTIIVLFYHGKEPWSPSPILSHYGAVPDEFTEFLPTFQFLIVNLQQKTDAEITAMHDALLLRNVYFALKHAREDDFFRAHYREVLIFAAENVSEDVQMTLFRSTAVYIQMVSSIKKEEMMQMVQTLPPQYEPQFKSTYDQIVEESFEKGMEKGMEQSQGLFTLKLWSLQQFSLSRIAELVGVEESQVGQTILHFLQQGGSTEAEALLMLERYKEKHQGRQN